MKNKHHPLKGNTHLKLLVHCDGKFFPVRYITDRQDVANQIMADDSTVALISETESGSYLLADIEPTSTLVDENKPKKPKKNKAK